MQRVHNDPPRESDPIHAQSLVMAAFSTDSRKSRQRVYSEMRKRIWMLWLIVREGIRKAISMGSRRAKKSRRRQKKAAMDQLDYETVGHVWPQLY